MQTNLPLLGDVSTSATELNWREIALCDTEQAAFRLCMRHDRSRRSQEKIAEVMGYAHATFSAIVNSDRHKSRPRHSGRVFQVELQRACGNKAIDQWADLYERGGLVCQRSEAQRIEELEAELRELRG